MFEQGRKESLQKYYTGQDLIRYFTGINPSCILLEPIIRSSEELGRGYFGSVHKVDIPTSNGVKTYAVKRTNQFDSASTCTFYPENALVDDWLPVDAGTLICEAGKSPIPEFIISLLVADLYRAGRCIHFVDVYYLMNCMENSYTFTEMIHAPEKSLDLINRLSDDMATCIFIQLLCAIGAYRTYYDIIHNDLHLGNILIEPVTDDMFYNGSKISDADYYHYRIGKTNIYIPGGKRCPYIVKIIDWGQAVKLSDPKIILKQFLGRTDKLTNNDILWLFGEFTVGMIEPHRINNSFVNNFISMTFGQTLDPSSPTYDDDMRNLTNTAQWPSAVEILTREYLMERFMQRPANGSKIVTLGYY